MCAKQLRGSEHSKRICCARRVLLEGALAQGTATGCGPRRSICERRAPLDSGPLIDARRDEAARLCAALIDPQCSVQH